VPCFQSRTTTLEAAGADLDVMAAALRSVGFEAFVRAQDRTIRLTTKAGISGYWADGRVVMAGRVSVDEGEIKRAYSRESIVQTARKQGWQVRFQASGEILATRRRFS
jgi:hypothetical protein